MMTNSEIINMNFLDDKKIFHEIFLKINYLLYIS
jgi:hypothetical protein